MPNRRSILIGLGGVIAGGGALLGTGAFTTVEAQRTVNIETTDDASAFLALSAARGDGDFVTETDGTIAINLDGSEGDAGGLNQNAITTFRNLVTITNNGTQAVTSLTLTFTTTPENVTADDTFRFTVSPADDNGSQAVVDNGADILSDDADVSEELGAGDAINFGIEIDLIDGGDGDALPEEGSYTLQIDAQTANSN
jgi:hypothetical protein